MDTTRYIINFYFIKILNRLPILQKAQLYKKYIYKKI